MEMYSTRSLQHRKEPPTLSFCPWLLARGYLGILKPSFPRAIVSKHQLRPAPRHSGFAGIGMLPCLYQRPGFAGPVLFCAGFSVQDQTA